jgi:SpoVK/Ycf46/Vps4 family AAA+-type ATPase
MSRELDNRESAVPNHGSVAPPSSEILPEGENKPERFRIRVENPDQIYQALKRGAGGELGILLLSAPLKSVNVDLESRREDEFNLIGSIKIDYSWLDNNSSSSVARDICKKAAENYVSAVSGAKVAERGGVYIVDTPDGRRFILCDDPITHNTVFITTGLVRSLDGDGFKQILSGGKFKQILPAPASTRENFDGTIKDFIDVLRYAVEEAHKTTGSQLTDEELVLRAPKEQEQQIKELLGLLGIEESMPEELVGRLEIEEPDTSFDDIGGQEDAMREIEGIAFALKNPDLYRKWGTRPPKGVILYGPPGTGKTLMARALAAQANARFFHVAVSDIASKWYGESEKIVKKIFELANQSEKPTIIFFDEIDAIAQRREVSNEVTQRIVSTLLVNMDGMVANDNVMIVASTNRLDAIDPALLRSGRFDRLVKVGLPDEEGRRHIFNIHMRKAEERAGRDLFDKDVDLQSILKNTDGLSGADIAEIVRRALEEKVRQEGMTGQDPGLVNTDDILRQVKTYEKIREEKKQIGF